MSAPGAVALSQADRQRIQIAFEARRTRSTVKVAIIVGMARER